MTKLKAGIILFLILLTLSLVFMGEGEIDMTHYLESPSLSHIFGFDYLGRDLFSRSCRGLVVSVTISLLSILLSLPITLLSLFLSFRGILKGIVRAVMKAVRSVPVVILALFLLSFDGSGEVKLITVLALGTSSSLFLLLEPLLRTYESENYIAAERNLGIPERKILLRHILPGMKNVVSEHLSQSAITAVLTESSLSFLGLGVDPSVSTLGRILSEGRTLVLTHPHTVICPSLMLFLLGLSILLVQNGFSELDSSLH